MGVTRPNDAQSNSSGSDVTDECFKTGSCLNLPGIPEFSSKNELSSNLKTLISRNSVCLEHTLFIFVFASSLVLLFFYCVTARRRRLSTAIISSVIFLSYFSIIFGLIDSHWMSGSPSRNRFTTSYCFYDSKSYVRANLQIDIGLSFFNVSYSTVDHVVLANGKRHFMRIDYVERFPFAPNKWSSEFSHSCDAKLAAFHRGLPNPIITVAEYLGSHGYDFQWGPKFTVAGDAASVTLKFALFFITLSTVLLIVVPPYSLITFPLTGGLMILSTVLYAVLVPDLDFKLFVEGISFHFQFGRSFYLVVIIGVIDTILGLICLGLLRLDLLYQVSTFFELDYDTPFGNRAISEDMKNRVEKPPKPKNEDLTDDFSMLRDSLRRWKSNVTRKKQESNFTTPKRTESKDRLIQMSASVGDNIETRPWHHRYSLRKPRNFSIQKSRTENFSDDQAIDFKIPRDVVFSQGPYITRSRCFSDAGPGSIGVRDIRESLHGGDECLSDVAEDASLEEESVFEENSDQ